MTPLLRLIAALVLTLILPVQGFAAASAQIFAVMQQAHHAEMMAAAAEEDGPGVVAGHCDKSDMGAGKCCNAHTFLVDLAVPVVATAPAFPGHTSFVARWTNFIPEEPSPPPIAVLRSA